MSYSIRNELQHRRDGRLPVDDPAMIRALLEAPPGVNSFLVPVRERKAWKRKYAGATKTMSGDRLEIINCLDIDSTSEIGRDIRNGLSQTPKSIPAKYFYDEKGSRLFEQICRLPEYYPTRTEIGILRDCAPRIMEYFAAGGDLVEIGCGSDVKIRRLLDGAASQNLHRLRYVPMDISGECLQQSAERLLRDYRWLRIHGIIGDFTRHLHLLPGGRKLMAFLGGTIGNFDVGAARRLLGNFREAMGSGDRLLIGIDMIKPVHIMEAAYNDSAGITARFNLNILDHLNRRLRADFNNADFLHHAFFNREKERIEMHLVARRQLRVTIRSLDMELEMRRGEAIHTESSHKFSRRSATAVFQAAGLSPEIWYSDSRGWFSLVQLRRAEKR